MGRGLLLEDRGHLTVKDDFSPLRYEKSLIYGKAFAFAKESNRIRKIDY